MYPVTYPQPRLILIRTQGIEVYNLKEGVIYRSIEVQAKIQLCTYKADHKFGALIATYVPASGCVDVYDPVLLLKLRSVKVIESGDDFVTAIDI